MNPGNRGKTGTKSCFPQWRPVCQWAMLQMRVILINIWTGMSSFAKQGDTAAAVTLATLRKGDRGVVTQVLEEDPEIFGDEAGASVSLRLIEIGFVPGERVHILEEIWPGGDPMAVRVGSAVFALRRREARAVLIRVDPP